MEYTALKEERAAEVGAEMIGEMVVYGIAAGVVFYEFWSSRRQSEARDRAQDELIAGARERAMRQESELLILRSRVEKLEADVMRQAKKAR